MSTSEAERKATLGKHVLILFPKVMQLILRGFINPRGLKVKYKKKDIRAALTDSEISFMEKLPSLDEFSVELCYKILRYEHVIDEPKCEWGNVPDSTEVEIADDIQRILNLTNEVIGKMSTEIPIEYYEDFQKETQEILKRIDAYLDDHDSCLKLYKTISKSDMNYIEIISKLRDVQPINVRANIDSDVDEGLKREFYSRISLVVIEQFPKILRNILQSLVSASELYRMCIPNLKCFTTDQQTSLQKLRQSSSYASLDINLIYRLLRQFSLIPHPTNGWGMYPDKTDIKVADDVERIRQCRNQIAHRCNPHFDKKEFEDYFNKFRDIGHRMDAMFFQETNYENEIIEIKTCRMDSDIQIKYTDAMKQLESIKLRFEERPIRFFWGENLETSLENLRYLLRKDTVEGKLRIQIIFQNEEDVESTIDILNSLRDDINENLSGIEFIVASKGSLILIVDILLKRMETDEILRSTLTLFVEKILEHIKISTPESIDVIVLPVEEYETWNTTKHIEESVYLDFNIEARLLETDDNMEEQLSKISEAIFKHNKGRGKKPYMSALVLPISIDQVAIVNCMFTTEKKNDKQLSDDYPSIETAARKMHWDKSNTTKTQTKVKKEPIKTDDSIQTTTSSLRTYCTIDESYADGTTERYDIMGDRGSASLDRNVSESKQKVLELKFGERIQTRPRSSSLSQLNVSIIEDDSEKDWFYKLNVTCDNYSLHLINDFNIQRKFKALSKIVQSKGSTRLTTEYSIDETCTAAFEIIYKHIICRNMLSMSDCIKQNLDLAVRFLLTRNIPPTELSEYLYESMKEKKNVISKAIGWTITKQFCKDILPTKVINSFIDIWPGFRCRCEKHRAKGHSRICSTEPVIIVEVDMFSKAIPDAFYGIPVQQSYQETKGEHTKVQCHKEKTDVSSFKDNIIQKPVTISGEIAEVLFKQHSKITMIHVHPFRRTSIQLWGQIKGVIPMGEKHFPKMINGLDTCIAEGHVRFMAKIKIGDTIGVPGSAGTLGGFVQMHGYNAFLTCAHVVHNKNRLIAGNKRELHKSKTKVFCLDRCNPNSSLESGYVFNEAFDFNNAGGTSVDAAVVILDEEKVSFDEKDILNKRSSAPVSSDFLGMKGPYLNDSYITPKAVSGTVAARYVGATSGYVESDVSFKDYDEDDDNFKTEPNGLCLYFKDLPAHLQDIESECPKPAETPFEVHFQQLMASKLEERIKSGRHFFRCYKQLLFTDFSFEPGDSGTCIYVVEDKTIIRPDNQPNPTGCLAMAIASFYDSNEKRNKCIATPMHAILKRLGLI